MASALSFLSAGVSSTMVNGSRQSSWGFITEFGQYHHERLTPGCQDPWHLTWHSRGERRQDVSVAPRQDLQPRWRSRAGELWDRAAALPPRQLVSCMLRLCYISGLCARGDGAFMPGRVGVPTWPARDFVHTRVLKHKYPLDRYCERHGEGKVLTRMWRFDMLLHSTVVPFHTQQITAAGYRENRRIGTSYRRISVKQTQEDAAIAPECKLVVTKKTITGGRSGAFPPSLPPTQAASAENQAA